MIETKNDYPLNQIVFFESYMFAVGERYMARHTSFDDMEIGFCNSQGIRLISGREFSARRAAIDEFNAFVSVAGWNLNSRDLTTAATYFGGTGDGTGAISEDWYSEYETWKKAIDGFCFGCNRVAGWVCHFAELEPNMIQMNFPHVHIIYTKNGDERNIYKKYIDKRLSS